ncbi:MAG: hypothetical protein KJO36_04290 [Acidimicrobiia bacterium]|nr:hypothetical protein [Acidimicrobiia bacterium]
MNKLKISVGDLVNYKPRWNPPAVRTDRSRLAGLPVNGKMITGVVASITERHGVIEVSLRGGPDAKYGGVVPYHRSRFEVVTKGYETHNPHTGERQVPETDAEEQVTEAQELLETMLDEAAKPADTKPLNKKERTIAIYAEVGGVRKAGMALLVSELGMSKAAASTYWQNVKSGKWA